MRALVCLVAMLPLAASAQVVTEWHRPSTAPVAVVETPGGDVETIALVVPATFVPPAGVFGAIPRTAPVAGGQIVTVRVPAMLAVAAAGEMFDALGSSPLAALVLLGPAPARDLAGVVSRLDTTAQFSLVAPPCAIADGRIAVVRGADERVSLAFAAPGPSDPRFDLLPALAAWMRTRLAASLPGATAITELAGGCARIVAAAPVGDLEPRDALENLRTKVAQLPTVQPTEDELAVVRGRVERATAQWAADGAAAARALAERLARGGHVDAALVPPLVDAASLRSLVLTVVSGHAGDATIVEQERRGVAPSHQTLDNGVSYAWHWIAGTDAVLSVALGGVDPSSGRGALALVAQAAADAGWVVDTETLLGVPTVTLVVPHQDTVAALETIAQALVTAPPGTPGALDLRVAARLGLATDASGNTVSLAMALPVGADDAAEAVAKFFGALRPSAVQSSSPDLSPLDWVDGAAPARLAALIDVPASPAGLVAGEVVAERCRAAGYRTAWLAPAGRLVLEFEARGDPATVTDLDAVLAKGWKSLVAKPSADEVRAAAGRLLASLFGDLARATARDTAAGFLPFAIHATDLVGVDEQSVAVALAAAPPWAAVVRIGQGPRPSPPPAAAVPKSPARTPRRP